MSLFSRRDSVLGPPLPFTFSGSEAFEIPLRGLVVTGTVVDGTVQRGQHATVDLASGPRQVTVKAIDRGRKAVPSAERGDDVGLYLDGLVLSDLPSGQGQGGDVPVGRLGQVVVRG